MNRWQQADSIGVRRSTPWFNDDSHRLRMKEEPSMLRILIHSLFTCVDWDTDPRSIVHCWLTSVVPICLDVDSTKVARSPDWTRLMSSWSVEYCFWQWLEWLVVYACPVGQARILRWLIDEPSSEQRFHLRYNAFPLRTCSDIECRVDSVARESIGNNDEEFPRHSMPMSERTRRRDRMCPRLISDHYLGTRFRRWSGSRRYSTHHSFLGRSFTVDGWRSIGDCGNCWSRWRIRSVDRVLRWPGRHFLLVRSMGFAVERRSLTLRCWLRKNTGGDQWALSLFGKVERWDEVRWTRIQSSVRSKFLQERMVRCRRSTGTIQALWKIEGRSAFECVVSSSSVLVVVVVILIVIIIIIRFRGKTSRWWWTISGGGDQTWVWILDHKSKQGLDTGDEILRVRGKMNNVEDKQQHRSMGKTKTTSSTRVLLGICVG